MTPTHRTTRRLTAGLGVALALTAPLAPTVAAQSVTPATTAPGPSTSPPTTVVEQPAPTTSGTPTTTPVGPATSSLGDRVWLDLDADSAQDSGEPGIGNVVVALMRDGVEVARATTNAVGNYLFTGLPAGVYTVNVVSGLPNGVIPTAGTVSNTLLESPPATLAASSEIRTVDFGFVGSGEICSTVWLDNNGNGSRDSQEGVSKTTQVTLIGSNQIVYETKTDDRGNFCVKGLNLGTWTIAASGGKESTVAELTAAEPTKNLVQGIEVERAKAPSTLAFTGGSIASLLALAAAGITVGAVLVRRRPRRPQTDA